jgi:general secretion pathway protein A
MFEAHFGLRENPFSTSHDPRFVYPSPEHLEAVGHFRYGMQNREAFVLVTGEVGTGKTTAVQDLVSRLPQQAQVALIQNTTLSRPELIEEIARRFNVELEPGISKPTLISRLESALRTRCERGEFGLLVVDEAQNLSSDMLEEIRLLSNFELGPGRHFLICLVGQPELEERLARSELRQLRQRISVKYRLKPLDDEECARYIHHRIRVAGGDGERVFPIEAVRAVHAVTHGIPRENNIVAGQAMLNAYVEHSSIVRPEHVRQVVDEFSFRSVVSEIIEPPPPTPRPPAPEPPPPQTAPQRPSSPLETQPISKVSPVQPQPKQPLSASFPRPATPAVPPAAPPQPAARQAPAPSPPTPPPAAPAPPDAPVTPGPVFQPAAPEPPPVQPVEPPATAPSGAAPAITTPTPSAPTYADPPSRTIADWKASGLAGAEETGSVVEKVKRVGGKKVPAPVVFFVIVAVLVASVMLTGIGRELWGVFFPPAEETAALEEDLFQDEPPTPLTGEAETQNTAPAEGQAATTAVESDVPAEDADAVPTPSTDWTIQAASFRTEAGAQRALGIFASSTGLSGRIVPGEGDSVGWYHVYLGSFPDREAANDKGDELLAAGLIPEDRFPTRHTP